MIFTTHQILFGGLNRDEKDERGMWYISETGEVHTRFW
jgi:hypothetical protein